jgi:hypothetical protein
MLFGNRQISNNILVWHDTTLCDTVCQWLAAVDVFFMFYFPEFWCFIFLNLMVYLSEFQCFIFLNFDIFLFSPFSQHIGYKDYGDYWRSHYDSPTFEADLEDLLVQLQPLYQNLHTYVRSKLRKLYGEDKFPASGHIPAHLLGMKYVVTHLPEAGDK